MSETEIMQGSLSDSAAPFITVCVPVRNGSNTIRRTLDSILAQDYPNYEVIASDNCSTECFIGFCQFVSFDDLEQYLLQISPVEGERYMENIIDYLASAAFDRFY